MFRGALGGYTQMKAVTGLKHTHTPLYLTRFSHYSQLHFHGLLYLLAFYGVKASDTPEKSIFVSNSAVSLLLPKCCLQKRHLWVKA